jgi:hypothetical protein
MSQNYIYSNMARHTDWGASICQAAASCNTGKLSSNVHGVLPSVQHFDTSVKTLTS